MAIYHNFRISTNLQNDRFAIEFIVYKSSNSDIRMNLIYSLLKRTPFSWIETPDGLRLHICDDLYVYHQVRREYRFADLSGNDMVIDIGANIGVFSLLAARQGVQVLAVEPIMGDELCRNIAMNGVHHNIRVLECALGDGRETEITWGDRRRRVPTMTLSQIIDDMGGCTFLKVDCEGGEWFINPDELQGIHRIEMELHRKGNFWRYQAFIEGIRNNFSISYDPSPHSSIYGIIHGYSRGPLG